ncbi:teichoic acid D-Ala incorporation-associated protein DltX [Viridibacillus sp. FSL R5-0477]|uniref:D-Ala-teichoic acid biosynthesis protein n=1 Tax=Viridibacillus arenosi FSL R5-213 TaxID=1227360 RepID=W4F7R7_9BACL|nr:MULTISPECIES: teichoic acid D-Ala incorporation-associated protein DltX [Viridibacillus]ETT88329.1 D-Ala-teichoic acid biosynthesis protein [Viridibacillus arenosi FSL R5-213]OMC78346.1 hypothetical protein BK130_20740 [Viridibacillus sp. FSL H8-0123]OMC81943.1 hypothetical protein BK128_21015 [Viridibacillus sp. FSL H7-0596]OMC87606.1 hypothetical protein BK137_20360 [Viridibacillus arenosi]
MEKVRKLWNHTVTYVSMRTIYYLAILILLVLLYGFQDMNAGPFIYTEF